MDDMTAVIARFEDKLGNLLEDVLRTKLTINELCEMGGLEPRYPDAEQETDSARGGSAIRPDQYYGRPLATVVKEFLAMRRSSQQGAATVREIYEALVKGGYKFSAKNSDYAMRGLRTSLTKNPAFHRLPNNTYGLEEWYPAAKSADSKSDSAEQNDTGGDDQQDDAESSAAQSDPEAIQTED